MDKYIPPFDITEDMLDLVAEIMETLGQLGNVNKLERLPRLRKVSRIKSIHSSLAIENNTLSIEQVTDIIDGKRVVGPQEDIIAVKNAKEQRYQFTWPDKNKSILLANTPISATLRPCKEESVDFDNTQNLYIEGDNLEVLKLLQETYLGKIKMIYIDPPYNTGNDFVYNDDFAKDSEEYLDNSGQYDEYGNRLVQNSESNGRFHTDWLNMLYSRLRLAKDLLSDDGAIFISIDDNEIENLRKMCTEIFGENNFVAQFIWKKKQGGGNDSNYVVAEHEYILCYAKNILSLYLGLDKKYKLDDALYPFSDDKETNGLRNKVIHFGLNEQDNEEYIRMERIEYDFFDKNKKLVIKLLRPIISNFEESFYLKTLIPEFE